MRLCARVVVGPVVMARGETVGPSGESVYGGRLLLQRRRSQRLGRVEGERRAVRPQRAHGRSGRLGAMPTTSVGPSHAEAARRAVDFRDDSAPPARRFRTGCRGIAGGNRPRRDCRRSLAGWGDHGREFPCRRPALRAAGPGGHGYRSEDRTKPDMRDPANYSIRDRTRGRFTGPPRWDASTRTPGAGSPRFGSTRRSSRILMEGRLRERGLARGSPMAAPLEDSELADARALAPASRPYLMPCPTSAS